VLRLVAVTSHHGVYRRVQKQNLETAWKAGKISKSGNITNRSSTDKKNRLKLQVVSNDAESWLLSGRQKKNFKKRMGSGKTVKNHEKKRNAGKMASRPPGDGGRREGCQPDAGGEAEPA
jgi:hypothetical protein